MTCVTTFLMQVLVGKNQRPAGGSEDKWEDFRVREGDVQEEACLELLLAIPETPQPSAFGLGQPTGLWEGLPALTHQEGTGLSKSMFLAQSACDGAD